MASIKKVIQASRNAGPVGVALAFAGVAIMFTSTVLVTLFNDVALPKGEEPKEEKDKKPELKTEVLRNA